MKGLTKQMLGDAGRLDRSYGARVILHTTEGGSYPGPHIYHDTHPTFTCDIKKRRTYQHTGVDRCAMALENHSGGVETNRANAVQIEIVGFTAEAGHWTDGDYAYLHSLLVHIRNAGHPFRWHCATPWAQRRFTLPHWRKFNGICGHMHVPENKHTDPGTHLKVRRVLGR